MSVNNEVGRRLAELIEDQGWTPNRAADEFGTSASRVKSWLDGDSIPGGQNLLKIQRATGASIDWLLLERGEKYPLEPTEIERAFWDIADRVDQARGLGVSRTAIE